MFECVSVCVCVCVCVCACLRTQRSHSRYLLNASSSLQGCQAVPVVQAA